MSILIGIDPGEHTGFAVWDVRHKTLLRIETIPIHRAMKIVADFWEGSKLTGEKMAVIFEDARQRKWFPREKNVSEYRGKLMGAGAAKRDARIWEEFLTDYGIPFKAHKPQAGGTKWSADYFAQVTGWTGRTSEHARDAALLVYGR